MEEWDKGEFEKGKWEKKRINGEKEESVLHEFFCLLFTHLPISPFILFPFSLARIRRLRLPRA
jgi:hypothetical protein